jgi:rhodanese-related sulfurtransferase
MIRRLIRGLARRMVEGSPRIPGEASTGRRPPTTRDAWRPAPEPEPEEEGPAVEVEPATLGLWLKEGRPLLIVDIREGYEVASGSPEGGLWMPMNTVPERLAELPRDRALIICCAAGVRSFGVAHYLREQGYPEAWSLAEGVGCLPSLGLRLLPR